MKRSLLLRVAGPCGLVAVAVVSLVLARVWDAPRVLLGAGFAAVCTMTALVAAHLLGLDARLLVRRPDPGVRAVIREILRCARQAELHGLAAISRPTHRPRHPLLRFAIDLAKQGTDPRLVQGAVLDRCLIPGAGRASTDDTLADQALRSWRQLLRTELATGGGVLALIAGGLVLLVTGPHSLSPVVELAAAGLIAGGMLMVVSQFMHLPARASHDERARLLIASIVSAGAAGIAAGTPVGEIERILRVLAAGEDAAASMPRAA